ncbi:MAG TPA: transposase [Cytophagales bacterium]|nr:transposase [Cytophagales bacterium]
MTILDSRFMPQNYILPLEPGCYYHVYNRAIGKELMFYNEGNYFYFLKKYHQYLSDCVDTYAYCLIPNHFHLLIRTPDNLLQSDKVVSEAFRRFGISFSQSINKQQSRKGSLFMRPFKRKKIESDDQLSAVIYYIHFNAVHHNIVQNLIHYKWSSFASILSEKPTHLRRAEVLEWFGGRENYIKSHKFQKDYYKKIQDLLIEL